MINIVAFDHDGESIIMSIEELREHIDQAEKINDIKYEKYFLTLDVNSYALVVYIVVKMTLKEYLLSLYISYEQSQFIESQYDFNSDIILHIGPSLNIVSHYYYHIAEFES